MFRLFRRLSRIPFAVVLAAATLPAVASRASSPEAWDEFRSAVAQACRNEASASYEVIDVVTDPFGSQDYGLALLQVRERGNGTRRGVICVFSKATEGVQLGTVLDVPAETTAGPPASVDQQTLP